MKTILVILFSLFIGIIVYAQQNPDEMIKNHFDDEEFTAIIEFIQTNGDEGLNDESLYYIGLSYFDMNDLENALKYFSIVERNDPDHVGSKYYKGVSKFNMGEHDEAFRLMDESSEISGKVFYQEEKSAMLSSLNRYDEAFEILNGIYASGKTMNSRGYLLLSDFLKDKNESVLAIQVLETAKSNADSDDSDLPIVLYKLGLEYNRVLNYSESNTNILRLLEIVPGIKMVYPIVIQNYNSQNDFISGMKYRGEIYTDFENGSLDEEFGNRFMFDEFTWNGKIVRGFERLDPPDEKREYPFYKHLYYVINSEDEVDFTIQTELFFGREFTNIDYVLGRSEYIGDEYFHETYGMLNFNEPVLDYERLRNSVMKILNKEVSPTSSSKRKTKE